MKWRCTRFRCLLTRGRWVVSMYVFMLLVGWLNAGFDSIALVHFISFKMYMVKKNCICLVCFNALFALFLFLFYIYFYFYFCLCVFHSLISCFLCVRSYSRFKLSGLSTCIPIGFFFCFHAAIKSWMFLLLSLLLVFAPYTQYTTIIIITISKAFLILIRIIILQYLLLFCPNIFKNELNVCPLKMNSSSIVHRRNINDHEGDDDNDNDLRFTHFSSFSFNSFNIIWLPVHCARFGSFQFSFDLFCKCFVLIAVCLELGPWLNVQSFCCECGIFNNFRVY